LAAADFEAGQAVHHSHCRRIAAYALADELRYGLRRDLFVQGLDLQRGRGEQRHEVSYG
jgi:hypothetical protein